MVVSETTKVLKWLFFKKKYQQINQNNHSK